MKLKIKILKKLSKFLIKNLYTFRKLCTDNKCLDESWFLDYQDELNKLSIDPDRNEKSSWKICIRQQEIADRINRKIKEDLEKEINKVFHNFKFKKKGEHLN